MEESLLWSLSRGLHFYNILMTPHPCHPLATAFCRGQVAHPGRRCHSPNSLQIAHLFVPITRFSPTSFPSLQSYWATGVSLLILVFRDVPSPSRRGSTKGWVGPGGPSSHHSQCSWGQGSQVTANISDICEVVELWIHKLCWANIYIHMWALLRCLGEKSSLKFHFFPLLWMTFLKNVTLISLFEGGNDVFWFFQNRNVLLKVANQLLKSIWVN